MENGVPAFTEKDILSGAYSGGKYYIPAPQKTDWEIIPLSEEELAEEIKRVEEAIASLEEELVREPVQEAERERVEQEPDLEEEIKRLEEELEDLKRKLEDENISSSQSVREEIYYPTEEIVGESSVDYLPNEEIVVTARPAGTSTKCYVYVKADYANAENQYLSELDYINSELMAAAVQVIVTE